MPTLRNRVYYSVKPYVPRGLRLHVRRFVVARQRRAHLGTWPVDPAAATAPNGWPGWPDGKKFALVLTHDVEGPDGLEKVRQLAEAEMALGFRSSFNFIPEGPYRVPASLRQWLTDNGFEVGVHDLHHDGKLIFSRPDFRDKAGRINRYAREWGATGFRAGFMFRNLEWYHHLDVDYDASTFDTDPFEPQAEGTKTIYPFWVPAPSQQAATPKAAGSTDLGALSTPGLAKVESLVSSQGPIAPGDTSAPRPLSNRQEGSGPAPRNGYVELPYTLPQDSTLFLLLKEKSPRIWLDKLDWVAAHGGMALVNVHPDYIALPAERSSSYTFPLEHYSALLRHVRERHATTHWHALPRQVAGFMQGIPVQTRPTVPASIQVNSSPSRGPIWIDLENTPHIPFFAPIMRELRRRGYSVLVTARDAYQTCEMADLYHLDYQRIGRHYGQKMFLKACGLGIRTAQLIPFILRHRPILSLNHGSRAQVVASNLLGIPSVTIMDYEHSRGVGLGHPKWMIVPESVTEGAMGSKNPTRLLHYSGIKEDVYAPEVSPDPSIRTQLGLRGGGCLVVTVRPPATEAHYHNPEAEVLFEHFMQRAVRTPDLQVVLLPRNKRQEQEIRTRWPDWFGDGKVVIPAQVVDGLNLLWHSDLVVSGGGTMNREAAALGVPVYSIFRGTIGAVDRKLEQEGRLTLITSVEEVSNKILLQPRSKQPGTSATTRPALHDILTHLETIIRQEARS
jgi:predicted glycosyltransferase